MKPTTVGVTLGAALGLVDGLSAWFYPEARPMLAAIVIGSIVKGVLTGLAAGLVARRRRSIVLGIVTGLAVGLVLSTLAALGQPEHYWAIVLPGMLVGLITGIATQRARTALLVALCLAPAALHAMGAQAAAASTLARLDPLIGRWQGTSEGRPGKGRVEREYSRILGSRFVQVRNRTVYPPQERNVKGEEHDDIGIFSSDSARKTLVFRQFHVEGFVNQYVLEGAADGAPLVFVSEAIENIPLGWRARETYRLIGADELEEVFELAAPGQPFELYSRSRLTRVQ